MNLRQWLIGVAALPDLLRLWPGAKPFVERAMKLADDLSAAATEGPAVAPKELVTRSHSLSVEEAEIFNRMSGNIG